jgi:methylisocitrate lyase
MLRPSIPSPGTALRQQFAQGTVVLPGVFNGISALSATKAGASALYISGAGVTNAFLGVPDIALAGLNEFAAQAAAITQVAPVPVIADADTGFGEAWNVVRTVLEMERAGLAGIHLEDQVSPKRCGHLDGKAVIPAEQMQEKIAAAVSAKRDPNFVLIARTDARGVEGLDAAIGRANNYVNAGADAIFPEGLTSKEEFQIFRDQVKAPLLANMTEFGKTPLISVAEFEELRYEMVIFPMTAFRVMLKALDESYALLIEHGTQAGFLDRMRTRAELYATLDYPQYESETYRVG